MNRFRIQTIDGFLTAAECESFLATIESIGFDDQFAGDGRLLRSRAQFEDRHWADLIWQRLPPAIPSLSEMYDAHFLPEPLPQIPLNRFRPVQLNERFRCYKYGELEEFRRHQDFAHEYGPDKRTFYTVLIYLNAGYSGGQTRFDDVTVEPTLGQLVLFPHELAHEGCRVESGMKYTVRTDVVFAAEGS